MKKEMNPIAEVQKWSQELKLAKKEDLFSSLVIDYETGLVTRLFKNGKVKQNAGHINGSGRKIIRLSGKMYLLHRIIWQSAYGDIPEGMCIDHVDGNPLNNKLANLRLVTHKQNMENVGRARIDNRVGVKGVKAANGKFGARIASSNKNIWLGTYETLEEASLAYMTASKKYHTHNPLAKA